MKRIILFILFVVVSLQTLKSQTASPKEEREIGRPGMTLTSGVGNSAGQESSSPSPQGSLKNYLNMQTGAVVFSVPLGSVSSYQLSIPLSLSYYSNGIRVEQESFPVGLGWSLKAGGYITRKLKGLPDESENGYLNKYSELEDFLSLTTEQENEKKQFIDNVLDKKIDGQCDIFQISLPGVNAYFTINNSKEIVTYPKQNLKITPVISGFRIIEFTVITPEGIEYTFGDGSGRSVEQKRHKSLSVPLITNDERLRIPTHARYYLSSTGETVYIDDYVLGPEPNQNSVWNWSLAELGGASINDYYEEVGEPEIDYDNIKEEDGELYNTKWYLSRIKHPSNDIIYFNYEKSDRRVIAERPIVVKSSMDYMYNSLHHAPVLTLDDPHYSVQEASGNEIMTLLSPKYFYKEYQYVNPDFSSITTSTGENYYDLVPPTYCNKTLYFSPSYHYTLRAAENYDVILKSVIASSGQKAEFIYEPQGSFRNVLRNVKLYNRNNLITEFILDNDVVTSSHLSSPEYNYFNMVEALVSRELDLDASEVANVNSLNDHEIAFKNESLKDFVLEGIKPNLYKRLILNRVISKTSESTQIVNEFTYNQPEKLPRSNSLLKNVMGFPLVESAFVSNVETLVLNSNDVSIQTIQPIEAKNESDYDASLGILTEVKNAAGGITKFLYRKEYGARLDEVQQFSGMDQDETPISITISNKNPYYSSLYAPITPFSSYKYVFHQTDLRDFSPYYLQGITSLSEYVNDFSWFENDVYQFSTCKIIYAGNGSETFTFTKPEDIGSVSSDNRVHIIPAELFKDQYDVDTQEFGVSEYKSVVDHYDKYPFANIKSYGFAIGNIKEHKIFAENSNVPLSRTVYNYDYHTDSDELTKSTSIIGNKMIFGYYRHDHCDFNIGDWCVTGWIPKIKSKERYRAGIYELVSFSYQLENVMKYDTDIMTEEEIISLTESKINETTLMNRRTVNDLPNNEGTLQTITLFADDFANNSGFIGALKDNNLKTLPIEQVSYRVDALGNTYILGAQHYIYDESNPLQILEQYHLELDEPLPLSEFRFANAQFMGQIPDDNFIGIYARYLGYIKTNIENKYDGLNRIFASKGEDELWSGKIYDMHSNSPIAEISNQELMITEESLNLENTENLSGSDIEHDLNITLTINKAQTVAIELESNATENDNFYFKLLTNGVIRQSSIWTSNKTYNLTLEPGVYDVEFYTQKNEPDQNGYYKTMRIAYVSDQLNALFSSFEEEGTESIDARTGEKYYHGIFKVPVSIDVPSEYVMSYWYYSGGEWQFSGEIPFQATVNAGAPIDDLKVYKKDALMKGYVYDKKGLLIAEIDANENRVLNEYDELNRLKIVRNTDKDIVKKYEYQIIHQQ